MKLKSTFLIHVFNIFIIFIIMIFFNTLLTTTSFATDTENNVENSLNQTDSSSKSESVSSESDSKSDSDSNSNSDSSEQIIKKITENAYGLFKEKITSTISETTEKYTNNTENQTKDTENTKNAEKPELNLYSKACVLIERSTNRIAYEKNADERIYPASTTKLLTAILTIEHCNLSDTVTITNDMVSQIPPEYTTAYLRPGEQVTVEQLLNSLLIPSANDAGFALAIHISGSVEKFSDLMNEKATQIGCTNSHFTNPSGIHNDNHYSTARDMSLIGMYSLKYNEITEICKKTSYSLHPANSYERTFETTNTLMKPSEPNYYEFANGLKTGFTNPAGSCIIATAKKDNMEFLVVVLGAPAPDNTTNYRDVDCKTLFEYGFANYEEITKPDEKVVNFFNDFVSGGITLSTFIRIGASAIGVYVVYTVFKICLKKN